VASPFKDKRQEEAYIVKFVVETQRSYERQTNPDRVKWKVYEELFAGKQDWGPENEREEWMSRCFIHEFAPIVRDVATYIQNTILERSDELVNLIPPDESGKEMASIIEILIRHFLDRMGFYKNFYDWALCGGIYGFATWKLFTDNKICWKPEVVIQQIKKAESKQKAGLRKVEGAKPVIVPDSMEEIERGLAEASDRLFGASAKPPTFESKKYLELIFCLDNVYPLNFFWSPDSTDVNLAPVKIERIRKKLFELEPSFENGFFNAKKIDKLTKGFTTGTSAGSVNPIESETFRVRDQTMQKLEWFPDVELLEYYGPLTYLDGKTIRENCHFVVANGKHLIRNNEIQTWSRRDPYFTTVFSRRPFKADGVGVADGAASLQIIINDLFSMFVDKLKLDIYAPQLIRTDMLADRSQIDGGIAPGILIETVDDPGNVIAELPKTATDVATPLYQTIEKLSLSGQKAAAVNTMTANPASRARITGTEINANENRRQLAVNQIVTEVDLTSIQPVIEHTKALVLQYVFNPQVLEQLTKEGVLTESQKSFILAMSPIERFYEANKNYKLDVKGFRIVLERNEQLMRLGEFLQRLPALPPPAQQQINYRNLLIQMVEAYGFNAENLILSLTPQDRAREENQFILKQMVQPAEDDDDFAHLGVHYEVLMQNGPVETAMFHINEHVKRATLRGENIPPPPPEVAQMLGLPDPKQMMNGAPPPTIN
jgi:hypothetical protein